MMNDDDDEFSFDEFDFQQLKGKLRNQEIEE